MGGMPIFRRCVSALACLLVLFGLLFVGAENATGLRFTVLVAGFLITFPCDQLLRLIHVVGDHRPEPKDFQFAAAIDPAEGHFEPDDWTMIGTITEVRSLLDDEPEVART